MMVIHHQVNYFTSNSNEEKMANLMSNKHKGPNFVANITLRQLLSTSALSWLLWKTVHLGCQNDKPNTGIESCSWILENIYESK